MNSRRSFFQSLAKAAAIVALAPQLAFRAKAIPFEISPSLFAAELNFKAFGHKPTFAGSDFYGFIMSLPPYDKTELEKHGPPVMLANQPGPSSNRPSESELRRIFGC